MSPRNFLCSSLVAITALGQPALAHTPIYSVPGRTFSVGNAGDVDADGTPDLVVGVPDGGSGRGEAKVWSGRTKSLLWQFLGDAAGDEAGFSVTGAGDIDVDGHDDIAVAINASDLPGLNAGIVRIFSGADGHVLRQYQPTHVPFARFGYSVAKLRDCNRDGYPDLAVGAPFDASPTGHGGSVTVLSGLDGTLLWSAFAANDEDVFGFSLAAAGDVNGDDRTDLLVGANQSTNLDPGYAVVLSGLDGSVLRTFLGDAPGDRFGSSVAGGGDINGDGTPDFLVGAPDSGGGSTHFGLIRAWSGSDGSVIRTTRFFGRLGTAVAVLGDVDGDDAADYVAGAPGWNGGSAYLFSGRTGKLLRRFNALSPSDMLGGSLAAADDVDGDGTPDLAIGARFGSLFGTGLGYASVFSGRVINSQH
jgi:hypothetical protein